MRYSTFERIALALALVRAGCSLTDDIGQWLRPDDLLAGAVPTHAICGGRAVYVVLARPGYPLAQAVSRLSRQGFPVGQALATVDLLGLSVFHGSAAGPDDTGGTNLVYEDDGFYLWRLAGKAPLEPVGLRPGDFTAPPRQEATPTGWLTRPKYTREEATRLNRVYFQMIEGLQQLGCEVYAINEETGHRVGPIKPLDVFHQWRPGKRWVDTPVIRPPQGAVVAVLAAKSIVELEQALAATRRVGEPTVVNKTTHFAIWLLPLVSPLVEDVAGQLGSLTVIAEEQPIDLGWLVA